MKKYLGFIFTLIITAPIFYSVYKIYEENNTQAIAGIYIQNTFDKEAINLKIADANRLADVILKETRLENLNAIKKGMAEPAEPLNIVKWSKYYFTYELYGQLSAVLILSLFILSLIHFIKTFFIERLNKRRRFFNYR